MRRPAVHNNTTLSTCPPRARNHSPTSWCAAAVFDDVDVYDYVDNDVYAEQVLYRADAVNDDHAVNSVCSGLGVRGVVAVKRL